MAFQAKQTTETAPPIAPEQIKKYFLEECEEDIGGFGNIGFYLDYLDAQIQLLPQMIHNDPEDKEINRMIDGMQFMVQEMRIFLEGNIDRALGSLADYSRGKRIWE